MHTLNKCENKGVNKGARCHTWEAPSSGVGVAEPLLAGRAVQDTSWAGSPGLVGQGLLMDRCRGPPASCMPLLTKGSQAQACPPLPSVWDGGGPEPVFATWMVSQPGLGMWPECRWPKRMGETVLLGPWVM